MKFGRAILLFGAITLFAIYLDADQLGAYFLFKALMGLLVIPADFGIRGALEKRLSEGDDPESVLGSALALKFVAVGFVSLLVLAARAPINGYLGADLAPLLVVVIVLNEVANFLIQTLRGELRVGETAGILFAWRVVWVVVAVLFVVAGFGIEGIIFGHIVGAVATILWTAAKCETVPGMPSLEQAKSIIAFGKYQSITSVGGKVYQWMDVAIVGFFLTQTHVSAYELAWQITLLVLMLSESISLSLFPQVSHWSANSGSEKIGPTISRAMGFAMFISIPAFIGGTIYREEILRFVFGSEYTIASTVLVVLLIEKFFQSYQGIIESTVRAIDRPDLAAKATVVTVGVNLVLSPLLVVSIGFVGAAIATTVSWLVNAVLHTRYLSRFVSVSVPFGLLAWYALASLIMGVTLLGVRSIVPVDGVFVLLGQIGIGAATYLGVSVLVPEVRARTILPALRIVVGRNASPFTDKS